MLQNEVPKLSSADYSFLASSFYISLVIVIIIIVIIVHGENNRVVLVLNIYVTARFTT